MVRRIFDACLLFPGQKLGVQYKGGVKLEFMRNLFDSIKKFVIWLIWKVKKYLKNSIKINLKFVRLDSTPPLTWNFYFSGIFLRVRECKVVLLAGPSKGCFIQSPYVDEYGETDPGLRRGNPLRLCPEKYRKIYKLWLNHGIPQEISHLLEANHYNMHTPWFQLWDEKYENKFYWD